MIRYHKKLKVLLFEKEIDHKTLAEKLGKCQTYLSHRITGKKPFTMDDVYIICDYAQIPYSDIPIYFPRGGKES